MGLLERISDCWDAEKVVGPYFAPVLATERLPPSFLAVTSQAIKEQDNPRMGARVAAILFCLLHIRVRTAGMTAEEMMTPIIR